MNKLPAIFMILAVIGCKPEKLAVKPTGHAVATVEKSAGKGGLVLAMIGKREVTFREVKRVRDAMPIVQRLMFAGKKGLRHMVEAYIELLVFAMEGKRAGLDKSPMSMEGVRRFEALAYIRYLVRKKVGNLHFSDKELRAFYDGHPDYFHLPERHKCLDIHLDDEKKIHIVYDRLSIALSDSMKSNPEQIFQDFVKRYSKDAKKAGHGLGFLPRVDDTSAPVAPEVVKEAANMHVIFAVGKPFKASDGYHILFLQQVKPAVNLDFVSARPKLENLLKKQVETKAGKAIVHSFLSQARVKINNKVLDEIK